MKAQLALWIGLWSALPGVHPALAAEIPVREQFAYAAPITLRGTAAVQRIDVPLPVYRDALSAQLDDLRVLNGRGEVVPFALERPSSEHSHAAAPVRWALFPLRGDPVAAVAALSLRIGAGTTAIEVQGAPPAAGGAPVSAYLLSAGGEPPAVEALTFEWAEGTADFAINAMIESSEDLATWRLVASRVPLARLQYGGEVFERHAVTLPAMRARFWRLRAAPGETLPVFSGVTATPVATHVAVERMPAAATAHGEPGKPGEYVFDFGANLPVDRLELALPDVNTVARVEFFARRSAGDPWRSVSRASVYRLASGSGELASPPLEVPSEASRYWRVVVDPRGGGIGRGLPTLRAGWLPHSLLFLVRGPPPFELVYGGFGAAPAAVELAVLLPPGTLRDPQIADDIASLATVGDPVLAGGRAQLQAPPPPTPWRKWLMWFALFGGVITLALVAWRLARQIQAGS